MKLLKQLAIFFVLCLCGQAIAQVLPFSFPASIISMVVLLILLFLKVIKEEHIGETADFLLQNMSFFFIPAAVGILQNIGLLKGKLFSFFAICLISTAVTFAVAAGVCNLCISLQNKRRGTNE